MGEVSAAARPAAEPARLAELTLFGPMELRDRRGRSILPRSRKVRALLAVLVLAPIEGCDRAGLASLLWSRSSPGQARGSLRQALHELQASLLPIGPNLIGLRPDLIRLDASPIGSDVAALIAPAGGSAPILDLLDRGALWSRPLLADIADVDPAFTAWVGAAQAKLLATAVAEAETAYTDAALAPAASADLIRAAVRVQRLTPQREDVCRAVMSTLAASGDNFGAERIFQLGTAIRIRAGAGVFSADIRSLAGVIRGARPRRPMPEQGFGAEHPASETAIRLGVTAFRPLGADSLPGDAALCAGLAEEITTAMSRFRGIQLVASSSLAAVRAGPEGAADDAVMPCLNLDFVLEGTVQRHGERVRVTARLVDLRAPTPGGELAWTGRFDRPTTDLLAIQNDIAAETVAQVDPALLLRAGHAHLEPRPALHLADASAHALLLHAIPAIYRMEEGQFGAAGAGLAQAIARSPDYAAPHAWYAYWHLFQVGQGWAADPARAMERAGELADRAVALDPTDARGLTIAGHVRAFLRHDIEEALALHERALDLNPNLPLAWVLSGLALCYAGQHEPAIRHVEQAKRLSPFDPHSFFFDMGLSFPLLMLGRYQDALAASRRAATINPSLSSSYKGYLAALGLMGEPAGDPALGGGAAMVRAHLLRLEPDFTVAKARSRSPLRREQDLDVYLEGLRRGGLPER